MNWNNLIGIFLGTKDWEEIFTIEKVSSVAGHVRKEFSKIFFTAEKVET